MFIDAYAFNCLISQRYAFLAFDITIWYWISTILATKRSSTCAYLEFTWFTCLLWFLLYVFIVCMYPCFVRNDEIKLWNHINIWRSYCSVHKMLSLYIFHHLLELFRLRIFSPSGEQPERRLFAHMFWQPTARFIIIFHKYCCCTKHGEIITNLTPRNR